MTIVYRDSFRDTTARQERISRMLLRICHTQEDLTPGGCPPAVCPIPPSDRNEG
jgi:hypothetical protein